MPPRRFRRKPDECVAIQYTGDPENATEVIDWALSLGMTARYVCNELVDTGTCTELSEDHHLVVTQSEKSYSLVLLPGDYLMYRGEHSKEPQGAHATSKVIFERDFELVPDSPVIIMNRSR